MSRVRGLSLIEVLLAIGLVAVAALTMISMFLYGLEASAKSSDIAAATAVGQQIVERVRRMHKLQGFGATPTGSFVFDGRVPQPAVANFPPSPYPEATLNKRRYPVVVTGTQPSGFLKTMRVEVYYEPGKKITLETHIHP
jgi:uncharacterized protein (TIGR02598 family)